MRRRADDASGRLDRPGAGRTGPSARGRGSGGTGRVDRRTGASATCEAWPVMILCSDDRQDRCGLEDQPTTANPAPAPGSFTSRRGGAYRRGGHRTGPDVWQGGLSVHQRRVAWALHLRRAAPGGGAHPLGLRAGRCGRSGASRGGYFGLCAPRIGRDLDDQYRVVGSRGACLNGAVGRGGGGASQHGRLRVGDTR